MGSVEVSQSAYGEYGKCVHITNGAVELYATLELGPRIIRFGKVGGPNEFYEDKDDNVNHSGDGMYNYFGKEKGDWHIYGGHRLWTSPESFPESYYPDNRPVEAEYTENGVVLTQEPQKENGVQFKMEISMNDDGIVSVNHIVENIGEKPLELASWALTVMEVGGLEAVPLTKRSPQFLHSRNISLWPYADPSDKRAEWTKDFFLLKTTSDTESNFKIGTNNEDGCVYYFNHGNLFIKRFDPFSPDKKYPDTNVNFETYTSKFIAEVEPLSELTVINPGETVSHRESWQLVADVKRPENEQELLNTIEKYK